MLTYIKSNYDKYFHEPQSILLTIVLLLAVPLIWWFGYLFVPFFVAVIIAYLLEAAIASMVRLRIHRKVSVIVVFLVFIFVSALVLVGFLPLLFDQIKELLREMPSMVNKGVAWLNQIPEKYPETISAQQFQSITEDLGKDLISSLQGNALNLSIASFSFLVTACVYVIIVPVLVFFLLMDKEIILKWFVGCLPEDKVWLSRIWSSMDKHLSNYIRGKFFEMVIIFLSCLTLFISLDLNYAPLLAVLVGLSVIIPYVGAIAVTVPVVLISLFQWGMHTDSYWLIGLYTLIQVIDGYLLVPILFSRAVNLHPLAVVFAILFFGGLWGLWGVFLSIPLATFVCVLIQSWPKPRVDAS